MDLIFDVFTKKWKEFLISFVVLFLAGWGLILTFRSADAAANQDPSPKPVALTSPSPLALPSPSTSPSPSPTADPSPTPSPSPEASASPSASPSGIPEATSAASKGGVNGDVNATPNSGPETWALIWSLAAIPGGLGLSGFRKGKIFKAKKPPVNMAKTGHDLVDHRKSHHQSK